jgi:ADP-heptose:LPS heptosyltransferase
MVQIARPEKILMIRLSSLGDVILATSALSAVHARPRLENRPEVHWVVSKEYASLLRGHPGIDKLWEFDRKSGFKGWLTLCGQLWKEEYSEVYDLHSTLRSKLAHLYFMIRGFSQRSAEQGRSGWHGVSKQRFQLYGYFGFKSLWPVSLRPKPFVARFAELVGGTGQERPDLRHLLESKEGYLPEPLIEFAQTPYYCVMPSSKWDGKKWPVRNFFEVISRQGLPVVVLGTKDDRESVLLVKLLEQAGFPYYSGVGSLNFPQLAVVMAHSQGFVGNDTGLGHLAEAVGSRAVVLFGPTSPEMGFGPWSEKSKSVSASVWCQPCGKDGRFCIRVTNRYACQKKITTKEVTSAIQKMVGSGRV